MGIRSDWSQLRPWAKAFLLHPMVVFAMFPFLNFSKETLFGVDAAGTGYLALCCICGLLPTIVIFDDRLQGFGWISLSAYVWLLWFSDSLSRIDAFVFPLWDLWVILVLTNALIHALTDKKSARTASSRTPLILLFLATIGLLVSSQNYARSLEAALLIGIPGIAGAFGLLAYLVGKRAKGHLPARQCK